MALPRLVSRQEQAVLAHPDQRSTWTIVMVADAADPIDPVVLQGRLERLWRRAPITGARLERDRWVPGDPPIPFVSSGTRADSADWGRRFALDRDAPLRVRLVELDRKLVVEGHHAAFDGLALATIVRALTSDADEDADAPDMVARRNRVASDGRAAEDSIWSRLAHPASRVAPSEMHPTGESFVAEDIQLEDGGGFTARFARACVDATIEHNRVRDARTTRLGISFGLGGSHAIGNTASYRRVDVDIDADGHPDADIADVVRHALSDEKEPAELRFAPPAARLVLRPIADRFSDSFLVSNLGVLDMPGVRRLAFFPVARGRSAVAFGAASVGRGRVTLTMRARDLERTDAQALLRDLAARVALVGAAHDAAVG